MYEYNNILLFYKLVLRSMFKSVRDLKIRTARLHHYTLPLPAPLHIAVT